MSRYPWYPELYRAHMSSERSHAMSGRAAWILAGLAVLVAAAYAILFISLILA
ncbi:hypothetical protein GCM10007913_07230 [Devosia yakushimensis]|uniref:Uncharacterized protein n=1 Tax=Devosia yakushimensis TaxID=470028 RepID=A0ABQ5UAD8_9HYPH|nr:hypothetical protein [Devosia yakushimensis]GLQ08791.1 hypothetical protein GCM10007913_07230 [Devosia yakushimensis]